MGDLLLLIGCSAAEVRKQLLPVGFIFSLDDRTSGKTRNTQLQKQVSNVKYNKGRQIHMV